MSPPTFLIMSTIRQHASRSASGRSQRFHRSASYFGPRETYATRLASPDRSIVPTTLSPAVKFLYQFPPGAMPPPRLNPDPKAPRTVRSPAISEASQAAGSIRLETRPKSIAYEIVRPAAASRAFFTAARGRLE